MPVIEPWYKPRVQMNDLLGPTGSSALTSGLALSVFAPPGLQIPAVVGGTLGDILAEEGTRRLAERMPQQDALALGTGLAVLSSLPLYKVYPQAMWIDLLNEAVDAIPVNSLVRTLGFDQPKTDRRPVPPGR